MSSASDGDEKRDAAPAWHTVLFFLTLSVCAAVPWGIRHWPSQDGPNHLAVAYVLQHYGDPGSLFPKYWAIDRGVRPSTAIYAVLSVAGRHAELQTVEKGLVSFAIALVPFSLWLFVRQSIPRRLPAVFLSLPWAIGWALGMGFVSFQLALGFGVLTLALAWAGESPQDPLMASRPRYRWWRHLSAAAAYLFCIWFHPVTGVLVASAFFLLEWRNTLSPSQWPRMFLVFGPATLFLAVSYAAGALPHDALLGESTESANFSQWVNELLALNIAYTPAELIPRGIAFAIVAFFAGRELDVQWRRGRAKGENLRWPFGAGAEGALARALVGFLLLYVVMPARLSGWNYCAARFLLVAFLLLPAVVEVATRWTHYVITAGVSLSGAVLVLQYPALVRRSAEMQEVLDVGATIPRGSKLIPMDFGLRALGPQTLAHAWAELVPSQGILTSQLFAAGKPLMGGERFRPISYLPGVLNIAAGTLPWSTTEHWYRESWDCMDVSSASCKADLTWRKGILDEVMGRYDYVLMIYPEPYAEELIHARFALRAHEGCAWLYEARNDASL